MPPPLWHPRFEIMRYFLYAIVENFPFGNAMASQCAAGPKKDAPRGGFRDGTCKNLLAPLCLKRGHDAGSPPHDDF
jgi:hypothetical protein